jgi:hypothetical protein
MLSAEEPSSMTGAMRQTKKESHDFAGKSLVFNVYDESYGIAVHSNSVTFG